MIPNSVESIGYSAFSGCSGLTSVEIPNSVESILSSTFSGCTGLTKIVSYATEPPTCDRSAFDGVDKSSCKLIVPDGCLDRYRSAEVWKEFLNMSGVYGVAVDDGAVKVTAAGGVITVSGAAADALVDVYSLDGSLVYSGRERSVGVPRAGVYVVRVAGKSQKVPVP